MLGGEHIARPSHAAKARPLGQRHYQWPPFIALAMIGPTPGTVINCRSMVELFNLLVPFTDMIMGYSKNQPPATSCAGSTPGRCASKSQYIDYFIRQCPGCGS
jgi:hypothetical protein